MDLLGFIVGVAWIWACWSPRSFGIHMAKIVKGYKAGMGITNR